jgi:hypothetical protein
MNCSISGFGTKLGSLLRYSKSSGFFLGIARLLKKQSAFSKQQSAGIFEAG